MADIFQRLGQERNHFFIKRTSELQASAQCAKTQPKLNYLCRSVGSVERHQIVVFSVLEVADKVLPSPGGEFLHPESALERSAAYPGTQLFYLERQNGRETLPFLSGVGDLADEQSSRHDDVNRGVEARKSWIGSLGGAKRGTGNKNGRRRRKKRR